MKNESNIGTVRVRQRKHGTLEFRAPARPGMKRGCGGLLLAGFLFLFALVGFDFGLPVPYFVAFGLWTLLAGFCLYFAATIFFPMRIRVSQDSIQTAWPVPFKCPADQVRGITFVVHDSKDGDAFQEYSILVKRHNGPARELLFALLNREQAHRIADSIEEVLHGGANAAADPAESHLKERDSLTIEEYGEGRGDANPQPGFLIRILYVIAILAEYWPIVGAVLFGLWYGFGQLKNGKMTDEESKDKAALVSPSSGQVNPSGDPGNGLLGYYFANPNFEGPAVNRVDAGVNFEWNQNAPGVGTLGADSYSIRWIGRIKATETGDHTFHTIADDGVRLWVDGKLLIDFWRVTPAIEKSGRIDLTAGQTYDLKLEYYEEAGEASIKLLWSLPSGKKSLIPAEALEAPLHP